MPEMQRASTPAAGEGSGPAVKLRVPPAMVERAAGRLCWISMICAVTFVVLYTLHGRLQPEAAELQKDPAQGLMALFVVLLSASMIAVQRFRLVSSYTLLRFGVLFQALVGFAIAFYETTVPFSPNEVVRGGSMVIAWVLVWGLLIPTTPLWSAMAVVLTASMWPLAYWMNQRLFGYEPMPWYRFTLWVFPIYLMALWTVFINKRMLRMETEAQKAEELGSYQLEYLIGRGGMGEVWKARHRMLARDSAIKLIRPEILVGQSGRQADIARRRFEREAKATARLKSPHTVYLFDFGVAKDGSFYYVMELLDGVSLQRLVEKFGPQPAARVAHILKQACQSLEEAHRAGLVHRDVKPTNLYLCALGLEYDFTKILDFGLVKNTTPGEGSLMTLEGMAAGTPAYMAPEVAMGERDIDGRSDIYSLGCVAYYLLTGHVVFQEVTPTATALAHLQKTPVPPSERTELPVPAELERIVLDCLAKKPEDRPRSAQELGRRLEALAEVPEWTAAEAVAWWQTNLPENSADRMPRLETAPAEAAVGRASTP
jgi:serine/threonine-protein kinase